MTQNARTHIASSADCPGVHDSPTDEVRGVGAVNLFGPLDLRQIRDLAARTRDWPEESVVDLNNTDGGSTVMVCRPPSDESQQGIETAPERQPVPKADRTRYERLISVLWRSRRYWQSFYNDPWRHYAVTELTPPDTRRYLVGHRHLDGWFVVGYGDALDRSAALGLLQEVAPESPGYEYRLLAFSEITEEPTDGRGSRSRR